MPQNVGQLVASGEPFRHVVQLDLDAHPESPTSVNTIT
jgi:hypothetical protein